jgi:hypothetical protein
VPRGLDRGEGVVMRGADLVQGVPEILHHMEAVCNLGRRRRAVPRAFRIGTRPSARNDPPPRDAPGAPVPGAPPCALAGAPRAGGAPGPPGSCQRCAVAAGRSHPLRAPGAWGTMGPAAGGACAAGCCGSSPRPTRGRAHPSLPPKRPAEGEQARREPQRAPRGPRWWAAVR